MLLALKSRCQEIYSSNLLPKKYVTEAYHSLSIEGYQISIELIEKVRSSKQNRDSDATDRERQNTLATREY